MGPGLGDSFRRPRRRGELADAATGRAWDFSRKPVEHSEIALPSGAPEWMADRQALWSAVEASERRCDARLGREIILGLPRELDREAQLELVRDFVAEHVTSRGMVCDWSLHEPVASDGKSQPHCHLLTMTRAIDPAKPTGFGKKMRELDRRDLIVEWRQGWEQSANHALELAGERSADRRPVARCPVLRTRSSGATSTGRPRIDRLPGVHSGPAAARDGARGHPTDIGDELRAIAEENAARAAAYEAVREMAADVPEAPGRFLEMRAASDDPVGAFEQWGEWAREQLEHLRELARDVVEHVQEVAVSAWDNLVAAMSPFSDFALAEREAAEEREAELDRAIDEVLAEMDMPEPQTGREGREHEREAEIEAPGMEDEDAWIDDVLAEMDRDDRERGWDQERDLEHDRDEPELEL